MAKYLFIYHGGDMPESPEEGQKFVKAWGDWFESLGGAIIDGGSPIGESSTIRSDGSVVDNGGSNPTTGYGVIEASSLQDAIVKAKGCPILASGGSVEIGETFDP